MKKTLSICLTVYNQYELVKKNIENLLLYDKDDIEIIISDDSSIDNIEKLINNYNDKRIVYIRTQTNVGHDLNILFALNHCSADYAIVLRSRDTLIPSQITKIIETISKYPDSSYYVFSALDEENNSKLSFTNKEYAKGIAAAKAHCKLFVHPSGNIYNIKLLNLDKYYDYLNFFDHNKAFIVHDLIRMDLATEGSFITSSKVVWIYANTNKAKDIAVNSMSNKKSVYDPTYEKERFLCELRFVCNSFDGDIKKIFLKRVLRRFTKSVGYDFKYTNNNTQLQSHYSFEKINYNRIDELRSFSELTKLEIRNYDLNDKLYIWFLLLLNSIKTLFYYPFRDFTLNKIIGKNNIIKLEKRIKGL